MAGIREVTQVMLTDPKAGMAVASATASTGFATIIDLIPDDIGKLATLVGIILSIVLIRNHLKSSKVLALDLALRTRELEEADRRAAANLAARRGSDT